MLGGFRVMVVMMVVVMVMVRAAYTTVSINGITQYFKNFPGYYVLGHVQTTLTGVSLVRCASACMTTRPSCRAFNFLFSPSSGTYGYSCEIIKWYWDLRPSPTAIIYYDRDMYINFDLSLDLGRLLKYSTEAPVKPRWYTAVYICGERWSEFLVPRSPKEWLWMLRKFWKNGTDALFVPIKTGGKSNQHYYWYTWDLNKTVVTPEFKIRLLEDDDPRTTCDGNREKYSDDNYCGLLKRSDLLGSFNDLDSIVSLANSPNMVPVRIVNCWCTVQKAMFFCEAGIPDEATHHLRYMGTAGEVADQDQYSYHP